MKNKDTNRRADVRVKARLKVRFKSVRAFISEYTRNISKGGFFIRTKKPRSVQDKVDVILVLPESEEDISVLTEVMHVVTEDEANEKEPAGMGLKILEIKDEDRFLIESFIKDKLKEMDMEGRGRKEHERHPSPIRVKFQNREALLEEHLQNISRGGIFIQTTRPKFPPEQVSIILIHPETNEEFKLTGEVVRIVSKEDAKNDPALKPGMGIRFLDMDDSQRSRLDKFIKEGP